MTKSSVIKVDGLVSAYGDDVILDRISFEIREGERFVILGGSGCGKSTLLKHLIGLLRPLEGSINILGEEIGGSDEGAFQAVLRQIGVLFQGGALFGSMTLAENIALPIMEYTDFSKQYVDTLVRMKLALVSLSGYENYLPSEISGGMRKRAGLARALAMNPRILFFDEPSAGLDPITSAELDNLILHLNHTLGTTMVIVTHELDSIFAIAQRVIMLDKNVKGIIAEGDPRQLRDQSRNRYVKQFFNRQPDSVEME
ncbi:MAG: ATP-binding cassette domain-containing protein [Desulfobulbaceae bacterium]|nr:ATP-binding cassette domain-containing protein [Desulfobulbaceae bacterium]